MLYTIFCYNDEKQTTAWSQAEDDAVMQRLAGVQQKYVAAGKKLGPVARLEPTGTATVLRKGRNGPVVTDGPFAETKEHLLGFYVVDVETIDEAVAFAKELQAANSGPSSYEIRPIMFFAVGGKPQQSV